MQDRILIYTVITLLGILMSSCGTSRTFQMDNSKNPLYYHNAYWVAKIKPEGAPAKITVINDMYIDTVTNRVTVYAQSKIGGKIVSPPQVGPGKCIETKNDTLCFHPNAVYLNGSGAELDSADGNGAWWGVWGAGGFIQQGMLFETGYQIGTKTDNFAEARGLAFAVKAAIHFQFWLLEICARHAARRLLNAM